mmetsp:Transcript_10228/g.29557  ORF Transcript_10228/g.29557 Transcript_10228/m.29557 type:complete len:331 (-) Transcript_10228:2781-3773(-)
MRRPFHSSTADRSFRSIDQSCGRGESIPKSRRHDSELLDTRRSTAHRCNARIRHVARRTNVSRQEQGHVSRQDHLDRHTAAARRTGRRQSSNTLLKSRKTLVSYLRICRYGFWLMSMSPSTASSRAPACGPLTATHSRPSTRLPSSSFTKSTGEEPFLSPSTAGGPGTLTAAGLVCCSSFRQASRRSTTRTLSPSVTSDTSWDSSLGGSPSPRLSLADEDTVLARRMEWGASTASSEGAAGGDGPGLMPVEVGVASGLPVGGKRGTRRVARSIPFSTVSLSASGKSFTTVWIGSLASMAATHATPARCSCGGSRKACSFAMALWHTFCST